MFLCEFYYLRCETIFSEKVYSNITLKEEKVAGGRRKCRESCEKNI